MKRVQFDNSRKTAKRLIYYLASFPFASSPAQSLPAHFVCLLGKKEENHIVYTFVKSTIVPNVAVCIQSIMIVKHHAPPLMSF